MTFGDLCHFMGGLNGRKALAISLLVLFAISTQSYYFDNQYSSEIGESNSEFATPLGQATTISIGSYPDGAVEKVSVSVPDGEVVQSMNLDIEPAPLSTSTAFSFADSADFSTSNSFSGVDVNGTELKLLARGWEYDFESNNNNWNLANDWYFGIDTVSSNPSTSTPIPSGAKSLYSFNGDYRNNMGSTLWAESPSMDCSGCSGTWEFKYQRQLGVESPSFDHAYVQVTDSSGNWKQLFSNSGSVSDFSWTQQTHDVSSEISNNPDFKIRFGIGSTDSSVTYSGWNIDDIQISKPTQGSTGNGLGSWSTGEITPVNIGTGEVRTYGPMYLDAFIPQGSLLEWSIFDSATDSVIPGFDRLSHMYFDLGIIDYLEYPNIYAEIYLEESPDGLSPVVYGIHFEGKLEDSLNNAQLDGWNLQACTLNAGQISGSGTAESPEYFLRSGFVGLYSESLISGSGKLEYSLDSGASWNILQSNSMQTLDKPHFSVMLRVSSTGSNWVLDTLSVELIRTSVAEGLEIDIGLDGIPDWTMERTGVGRLGIQDRFTDGNFWSSSQSAPSAPSSFSVFLPKDGIENFEFAVAGTGTNVVNPFLTVSVDNQDILTSSLNDFSNLEIIRLSSSQVSNINSVLTQSIVDLDLNGLELVEVTLKIGSSSTTTTILAGGLMATYSGELNLDFSGSDGLIIGMNSALQNTVALNGMRDLSIPIRMSSTGSISLTINSISSVPSITPVSIDVTNVTDTFTPSMNWIDVTSTFDFAGIGISNPLDYVMANSWLIDLNLVGKNQSAQLRCSTPELPIDGQAVSSCLETGVELIWYDLGSGGLISMTESSSLLQFNHRFKFPVEWDDEEFLVVSANMVSTNGPMLPVSKAFGLGNSQGVENDISVENWMIVGLNGIGSDINYPYLKKGEPVTVEVHLGFEGEEMTVPRTGHALVRLLVEGNEYGTSTIINDGIVSIPWVVPSVGDGVELEIDVLPLKSQGVTYEVDRIVDFGYDQESPRLLYMNVDEYDHFEANPSKLLEFTITDRPVLPSHAEVILWRSWIDDYNQDGEIDEGEVMRDNLVLPNDMMLLEGTYFYDLDTSNAPDGSYVRGWIDVADSAGNLLLDSGNISSPLFNLLVSSDGSPQLGYSELSWAFGDLPWLHPGENISLDIPLWDKNGITDITEIELDLSVNQPDSSTIFWNRNTEVCSSSTLYIQIISCQLEGDLNSGLFTNSGTFTLTFQIKWGFDPDDSIIRMPNILLTDLNGQSTAVDLNDLSWRYSGKMQVRNSALEYSITGVDDSETGAWVKARESIQISGSLEWLKTGRLVNQELDLLFLLGLNQATVDYGNSNFNGSIITPANPGSYPLSVSLRNAPNGASIVEPESPLLWFIVDDEVPSILSIDYPIANQVIEESSWSDLEIQMTFSEDKFLNEDSLYLKWEVHPSGFGFASSSIANGSEQVQILGGMPFGASIKAFVEVELDSVIPEASRTEPLELRIWINGSDMAGNYFGSVSDEIYTPFAVWQLEQQLPEYEFTQPQISNSRNLIVGESVDLSVVIENIGKSDGFAQLRVERVESNGARTILHAQEVKVQAGSSGFFTHRWTPDRDGSMWIEFIIIGGPTTQTDTFYVSDDSSDGFFGGISEIDPILLVIIFVLISSLVGLLIFGLRSPNKQPMQKLAPNKNYHQASTQVQQQQQNAQYAKQQTAYSPGDNPYK